MSTCKIGKVNSIETMGLVDGPGVRTVVFLQGCPLRCKYCHNPETWATDGTAKEYTPEQLCAFLLRYKNYMKHGGVTFSGGEPLLQTEFVRQTAALLKKENIHICLDTAGSAISSGLPELLDLTDLILLDVKAVDPAEYRDLTGSKIETFLTFLELIQKKEKKLWLRSVIVPGINHDAAHIAAFRRFFATVKNVERTEFLPYHTLGVKKYQALGMPYPLEGVPSLTEEELRLL